MTKHTVFVYGSLKRGFHNNYFLKGEQFLQEAVSDDKFEMWGWGFPFIAVSPSGLPVAGELWSVSNKVLTRLDVLEGIAQGFYRRESRSFSGVQAWVYLVDLPEEPVDSDDERVSRTEVLNWRNRR